MTLVSHYGLHADADLVFLHEQGRSVCLTPGLEALPSPFAVVGPARPCPHALPTPQPGEVPDHSLVRILGPIQDGGAYHVPSQYRALVGPMLQMVGPTRQILFPIWATRPEALVLESQLTNAAPLVIVDFEAKHIGLLSRLVALPRWRNLVLIGDLKVPGTETVSGSGLEVLHWPSVGAAILHNHIRSLA